MYRPLPDAVEIGPSVIEGVGLFAKDNIERGTNLGMSHLKLGQRKIRTPLGGFLNHSEHPNCFRSKLRFTDGNCHYTMWNLMTLVDIQDGEELTIKYEWDKIKVQSD